MATPIRVDVASEIGELQSVILHTPGCEVENMSPSNAARALYSDILNLEIAQSEYTPFRGVLSRICCVLEVGDLLAEVLDKPSPRAELLGLLCPSEFPELLEELGSLPSRELSRLLLEGVAMSRNTLTSFLREERYAIPPLYNFYFMRDASMSVYGHALIGSMASPVRWGETRIMDAIFRYSDSVQAPTLDPYGAGLTGDVRIEGGDVLVAREDVLLIGSGIRTSSLGIDYLIRELVRAGLSKSLHVVVQELPHAPESFIHLDMVFTLLDRDRCMVYAPLILGSTKYRTIHIEVQPDGRNRIRYADGILPTLRQLGMPLEPIVCGGTTDAWHQEREQWHSGTNFFAFAPGRVLGYSRNQHTIEELSRGGFAILPAAAVASGSVDPRSYDRCVVVVDGSELPRGGGGARCMTMPIARAAVAW